MTVIDTTTMNLKRDKTIRGWVFYDGNCSLCRNSARRFQNLLRRHSFDLTPLQTPWVCKRFHFRAGKFDEMVVLLPDNHAFGGADGIVQIARRIWWAWPLFAIAQVPGIMILLQAIYRRIAVNRSCFDGKCSIPKPLNKLTRL